MTITGSYPQTGLQDQQDYLALVNQTFKSVEAASNIVSVHSAVEPSQALLKSSWDTQVPFSPPVNGGKIQWFNPVTGKIEQMYYPVTGGASDLYPYKVKPTNIGMTFIAEQVIGTSAALSISSIPATFKHLFIQYSVRASGVGTATEPVGCRLNANVTATHAHLGYSIPSGGNPAVLTGTALTYGQVGFAPQGGLTDQFEASVGQIWIPNYSVTVFTASRWVFATCIGFTGNARPYTKAFQRMAHNSPAVGATASVTLLPITATTFLRGSKMVIWGLE